MALASGNKVLMMEHAVYSVISPEGCASILWKSADKKEAAADAMGLTAQRLSQLGLVDEVIEEPLGGAHRNHALIAERLKSAILRHLTSLEKLPPDELRSQRQSKIASFGVFSESED